jgi:hypothetical protein
MMPTAHNYNKKTNKGFIRIRNICIKKCENYEETLLLEECANKKWHGTA